MTNLLLYKEARQIIAEMHRHAANADHIEARIGNYLPQIPDEVFEELAREGNQTSSAYDDVLEELFRPQANAEPSFTY